jgi:hypothetical protein
MSAPSKQSVYQAQPAQRRLDDLLCRVRGEYDEMPGLSLTPAQAQRLWALDRATCALVLERLINTRFLRTTARGCYVRMEHPLS